MFRISLCSCRSEVFSWMSTLASEKWFCGLGLLGWKFLIISECSHFGEFGGWSQVVFAVLPCALQYQRMLSDWNFYVAWNPPWGHCRWICISFGGRIDCWQVLVETLCRWPKLLLPFVRAQHKGSLMAFPELAFKLFLPWIRASFGDKDRFGKHLLAESTWHFCDETDFNIAMSTSQWALCWCCFNLLCWHPTMLRFALGFRVLVDEGVWAWKRAHLSLALSSGFHAHVRGCESRSLSHVLAGIDVSYKRTWEKWRFSLS